MMYLVKHRDNFTFYYTTPGWWFGLESRARHEFMATVISVLDSSMDRYLLQRKGGGVEHRGLLFPGLSEHGKFKNKIFGEIYITFLSVTSKHSLQKCIIQMHNWEVCKSARFISDITPRIWVNALRAQYDPHFAWSSSRHLIPSKTAHLTKYFWMARHKSD
jgi:hypothetical protein